MIQVDEIHPEAWRRADLYRIRTSKRERKDKVGEVSYQCKHGDHKLHCMKLNCPCPCHDAERAAVSTSAAPAAGSRAAADGESGQQRRSGGASGASAPLGRE